MSEERVPYYPVSLRPGADLDEQLGTRGDSAGATMKRDLLRYYRSCAAELARMDFTEGEVNVLYELLAHRGDLGIDPSAPLWATVADAMEHNTVIGHHHLSDPDALVGKLRRLGPGGALAVIDALERASLYRTRTQGREEMGDTYRRVGLLRPDRTDQTPQRTAGDRLRRPRPDARSAGERLRRTRG